MIPSLLGLGVPRATALIAVMGWRLWQFWMLNPLAGLCYLSLRPGELRLRQPIRETADEWPHGADHGAPSATNPTEQR